MNIVSKCCKKPIGRSFETEYPLGGRVWGIEMSCPVCEGCGEDHPEEVEVCDSCGEEPDHRGFKKVDGDDWCHTCVGNELDELVEVLKKGTGLAG